jgi:hypothetical protein
MFALAGMAGSDDEWSDEENDNEAALKSTQHAKIVPIVAAPLTLGNPLQSKQGAGIPAPATQLPAILLPKAPTQPTPRGPTPPISAKPPTAAPIHTSTTAQSSPVPGPVKARQPPPTAPPPSALKQCQPERQPVPPSPLHPATYNPNTSVSTVTATNTTLLPSTAVRNSLPLSQSPLLSAIPAHAGSACVLGLPRLVLSSWK